ncbi:MAG: hypothetical protein PF795_10230 [Kiritimatiellae bacterium]|jgi:hypothetical protein|nr:hypothetical protein [Kiritimatiellia bacterium]
MKPTLSTLLKLIVLAMLIWIFTPPLFTMIPLRLNFAYGWVKEKMPQTEISHFPETLPIKAKMFYRQGYLQGGTVFQIFLPIDAMETEAISSSFAEKDSVTFVIEGRSKPPDEMPIPYLFAGMNNPASLSDGTELVIFKSRPYQQTGFNWNHGTTSGIAKNEKNGWLLYWYTSW